MQGGISAEKSRHHSGPAVLLAAGAFRAAAANPAPPRPIPGHPPDLSLVRIQAVLFEVVTLPKRDENTSCRHRQVGGDKRAPPAE
jgi:hypothetical protein